MIARSICVIAIFMLVGCGDSNSVPPKTSAPTKVSKTTTQETTKKSDLGNTAPIKPTEVILKPSLENGAKFYKKCAACHLPNGDGVAGSFPPLKDNYSILAGSPEGRAYLVGVVVNGVQGELLIDGVKYRGAMIAQGRTKPDQSIADVLNYISTQFHPNSELADFTAAEVSEIRAKQGRLSGKQVRLLRPE